MDGQFPAYDHDGFIIIWLTNALICLIMFGKILLYRFFSVANECFSENLNGGAQPTFMFLFLLTCGKTNIFSKAISLMICGYSTE